VLDVEAAVADHAAYLGAGAPLDLRRLDAPAGTSYALVDAVREVELDDATYAWGGAERRVIGAVGKHLRRDRGHAGALVSMTGYWRRV
jgi:NADPH-dependent ferric siderophore reductase